MKHQYILLLFTLLAVSCAPSPQAIATQLEGSSNSTLTLFSTSPPTLTYTPSITNTPSAIPTITSTTTPLSNSQTCLLKVQSVPENFSIAANSFKIKAEGNYENLLVFANPDNTNLIINSISIFPSPAEVIFPSAPLAAKEISTKLLGDMTKAYEYIPSPGSAGVQVDFSKGNVVVSLSVERTDSGISTFIDIEYAASLAEIIADCLPGTLPYPDKISIASEQLDQNTASEYLLRAELGQCTKDGFIPSSTFMLNDDSICFEWELLRTTNSVTLAIYSMSKEAYIDRFDARFEHTPGGRPTSYVGKTISLEIGDYQYMLLINDKLVIIIPFTIQ